jgi:Holliday junction resolvase
MDKVHRKAEQAEERVAQVFGGRRTAASGSGTKDKADVLTDTELFEVKYTEQAAYRLRLEDLLKLQTYADLKGRAPVLHITYGGRDRDYHYVVVPENEYFITGAVHFFDPASTD